jgi:hypothetical protein
MNLSPLVHQLIVLGTYGLYRLPYIADSYYDRYALPLAADRLRSWGSAGTWRDAGDSTEGGSSRSADIV